ncbi:glycosyltransferase family 87 protein [Natronoglycomyces albus]|uniref:DUF2029 domain-containing protein n=1 Tax=Natronoglycomyces albus TaxID=2811108 RepID=A0A895XUM7_9ACTN|nr:glycosyltransferase 87 family protein [Natronoglycomyces albus]QSB05358.1 DUF2029 domain-containing protein [Natronoglycomyces albus]
MTQGSETGEPGPDQAEEPSVAGAAKQASHGRDLIVAPSQEDGIVRAASELIGGPHGEHARTPRRAFWTPIRVILLVAVAVFALSWLQKYPCASGGWEDYQQYTQACYTDIRALYGAERLNEGAVPYRDHPVEYPVLTGWFMGIWGLSSYEIGQRSDINDGALFYHLNAIVLFAFGIAAVYALYAMRRNRPWDAMMLAAAPIMVVTASVNWDLFAIGLGMAFFLCWRRTHIFAAGVFLGLAVAAKFYALLFLGPLLLLALRNRRLAEPLITTATAALTWAAFNLPVAYFWTESWLEFFRLNETRHIDWGTGWYVLRDLTGWEALNDTEFVNDAYFLAFLTCCLAIAALAWLAPTTPRFAALCFLVVAAFLLTGKVWSQQFVLWLIPLLILARPKWGAFLVWQGAELGYFLAFYGKMLAVSTEDQRGISEGWFVLAAAARWLAVAWLCVLVVREVLQPQRDVVRTTSMMRGDPEPGIDPDAGLLKPTFKPKATAS